MRNGGDGAGNDIAYTILILRERIGALGVADLLHNHLTRSLSGDSSEARSGHLDLESLAFLYWNTLVEAFRALERNKTGTGILVGADKGIVNVERKIFTIDDNPKIIGNVMILLGSLG